jgi:hypothetical protein
VFRDAQYVTWANEETVHLLSYALDKNAEKPEPVVQATRDGEAVEVLAAYPMFTAADAERLVNEIDKAVKFPLKTPWVGVIAVDGATVLASGGRGTSKEYRELYEAQRKKAGPSLSHGTWRTVCDLLERSATAAGEERWKEAIAAALEARALVKSPPPALAERIEARVKSLDDDGRRALERANEKRHPADRATEVAKVRETFAGLPFLAEPAPAK